MTTTINAKSTGIGGLDVTCDASGALGLQTGGTTAVTIDTSQNVGIGTTSPYAKTQTYLTSATIPVNWIYRGTQNTGSVIPTTFGYPYLQIGAGEYASSGIALQTIGFGYVSANGNFPPAEIGLATTSISGQTYGDLVFATRSVTTNTAATERMRIDSSGVVLVGTSSYNPAVTSTCKFHVQNNGADFCGAFQNNASSSPYGLYVKYLNSAPNNTGSEFLYCADSGALRAAIRSNGGLYNYQANNANISDEREKTNIELAGSYLDKICAIPVKTFLYNDQTDTDLNLGVIAQDVQAVAPELVTESNWGTEEEPRQRLSIYQTDLQYALMKCIQEQQTIINDLKARIETLESK